MFRNQLLPFVIDPTTNPHVHAIESMQLNDECFVFRLIIISHHPEATEKVHDLPNAWLRYEIGNYRFA